MRVASSGFFLALVALVLAFVFADAGDAAAQRRGFNPDKGPAGKPLTVCCKICKRGKCTYSIRTVDRCHSAGGAAGNRTGCRRVCCRVSGPRAFIQLTQQACRDRHGFPERLLYCTCPRSARLVCCATRSPKQFKRMTERRCCFAYGKPVTDSRCRK